MSRPRAIALAAAALAAATVLALTASAGARPGGPVGAHVAARLPTLLTGWYGRLRVRPSSVYYTGDGSGVIGVLRAHGGLSGPGRGSLHWTRWSAAGASGHGTVWLKLGSPTATSPFTRFALTITAGRPRGGRFTRMTLHYRLRGKAVSDTRCIPDHGQVSGWSVTDRGRCLA